MALYKEPPVYPDTYQLILKVFELTKDFSRDFKHTLAQDMRRDAVQLLRGIFRANKATDKKAHLECFLDEFELLKLEIRLCVDMRLLSIKKQAELGRLIECISKQVIGWRNSSQ